MVSGRADKAVQDGALVFPRVSWVVIPAGLFSSSTNLYLADKTDQIRDKAAPL